MQFDLIALDADDTLWHNESMFSLTQAKFLELLSGYHTPEIIERRLYETERQAQGLSQQDRLALRQSQSLPVLDQLHQRLSAWKLQLLPKHPMAEASATSCGSGVS